MIERRKINMKSRLHHRLDDRSRAETQVVPLLAGERQLEPIEDTKLHVHAAARLVEKIASYVAYEAVNPSLIEIG